MIQSGYAWHFKRYSKDTELAAAEIVAIKNGAGLWEDPKPIHPWKWRKQK